MTQEEDGNAAQRQEIETRLKGLERLRMSGLVPQDRYDSLRAKLLADLEALGVSAPGAAAAPGSPAQPVPAPPQRQSSAFATYSVTPPAPQEAAKPALPTNTEAASSAPAPASSLGTTEPAAPAAGSLPPPATAPPTTTPATAAAVTAPRRGGISTTVVAAIAAVLLLGGGGAAFLATHGGNTTPASATAANATRPILPTPTASASVDLSHFGPQYLAAVGPLNTAWKNFEDAFANAPSGAACGCGTGEFSFKPVLPAYQALLSAYANSIRSLAKLEELLPDQAAADCHALIDDQEYSLTALRETFGDGTAASGHLAVIVQLSKDVEIEAGAANLVRNDLSLAPTSVAA